MRWGEKIRSVGLSIGNTRVCFTVLRKKATQQQLATTLKVLYVRYIDMLLYNIFKGHTMKNFLDNKKIKCYESIFNNTCSFSKELHAVSNDAMGTRPAEPGVWGTCDTKPLADAVRWRHKVHPSIARLESGDEHGTLVCVVWISQRSTAVNSALGQNFYGQGFP